MALQIKTFQPEHRKLTVAVLLGGTSSEKDVSLVSGKNVADALEAAGFQVRRVVVTADELPDLKGCDVVFSLLHGGFGENGGMQDLLDQAHIPYVGSNASASRLCMNKQRTKDRLQAHGLPVPLGMVMTESGTTLEMGLSLPLVVKPNNGGSSVALTIVRAPREFPEAVDRAFAERDEVLIEEFVEGVEITVGLIDGVALMPVEIRPPNGVYDYDAKYHYKNGKTQYFCPPECVPAEKYPEIRAIAEKAWTALGVRDLVRIDMIIDKKDGKPKILEANTLPGFTPTSLMPKAAQQAGVSYQQLCTHLVLTALARQKR